MRSLDIKIKQKENNVSIKKLDKISLCKNKMKDNIINVKKQSNFNEKENNSANEYSINKLQGSVNNIFQRGKSTVKAYTENSLNETKKNIENIKPKIKQRFKEKNIKDINIQLNNNLKNKRRNIKTINSTEKLIYKASKKNMKRKLKGTRKKYQISKIIAKNTLKGVKIGALSTFTIVKNAILATKALIATIVAGGWVVVLIIIFLCLISLICSSFFGIFFSSEDIVGDVKMNSVIRDINMDFTNKITEIQNSNEYDEYEIISNDRAEWKDILAIYTVIITKGEDVTDTITLNDNKINKLKEIFWNMNIITSKVEEVEKEVGITDENGEIKIEKQNIKILYITISSKSIEEMVEMYDFNNKQKEELAMLQKEEYASLWNSVIYGNLSASNEIVQVALLQLGNVGGQTYWSWYGFTSHIDWCACFVSWCANECRYIGSGKIPKFSYCQDGVNWFKINNLWEEKNYIPKEGDIIFFDWKENDTGIRNGIADHVGIVEKVEAGVVYTIEGNVDDMCLQKSYDLNSEDILGYGIV